MRYIEGWSKTSSEYRKESWRKQPEILGSGDDTGFRSIRETAGGGHTSGWKEVPEKVN